MDLRRIPDWGWTVLLGVVTVLAFGLMFALGPSGPGGSFRLPGTIIAIGVLGGLLARRAADLVGVVVGTVFVFEVLAAIEIVQHGGPLATLGFMLETAVVPGLFAAMLGLIVVAVRRSFTRAGVRSVVLRGAGVAVVLAAVAWLYVIAATRPTRVDVFRVIGERDLVVTVTGGEATWCRLTSVAETAADVTVAAGCVSLILAPTTAVGIPTDLGVHLVQPLGDRLVRDESGNVVRQYPPPVHAVDQDRAMEIARGVLEADHPGIAVENTKVLDMTLEKDASGRAAWKVNIIVVDGPFASAAPTSIWLWVDAESGVVTIISKT